MISKVTITGADDSVKPQDLAILQRYFPFAEWGILLSRKQYGNFRYPSKKWLDDLVKRSFELNLAGHLCGAFVRELVQGQDGFINELGEVWTILDRIQINFHGIPQAASSKMNDLLLRFPEKEFIFQYDETNHDILQQASKAGVNCSALFDRSHGTGVLPDEWPDPLVNIKCGYAGGLGPDNLSYQIEKIQYKVKDRDIWIDMESRVRSEDDSKFDLGKVRRCLSISAPSVFHLT